MITIPSFVCLSKGTNYLRFLLHLLSSTPESDLSGNFFHRSFFTHRQNPAQSCFSCGHAVFSIKADTNGYYLCVCCVPVAQINKAAIGGRVYVCMCFF
uniref:Uncharacterized protein n=1 Tax=Anopheles arabiensis TaxID=7173 RepID=A0A182IFK7_ANOAR